MTVPVILAASKPDYDASSVVTAAYVCSSCSAEFATQEGTTPFCYNCGAEPSALASSDNMPDEVCAASSSEVLSIECASCGTHNVMNVALASDLGGEMHCITCSSKLFFTHPDEDETASEDEYDEDDSTSTPAVSLPPPPPVDPAVVHASATGVVTASVMDGVTGDIHLITSSNKGGIIIAMIDTTPVAVLSRDGVKPEHREVANTKEFVSALKLDSTRMEPDTFLEHYGFKKVTASVHAGKAIENAVTASASAELASLSKKSARMQEVLSQSLAIAASALNCNLFPEHPNPLKTAIGVQLAGLGVQQPDSIVEAAFSSAGREYASTLLTLANDLASKGDEYRNTLAASLAHMNVIHRGAVTSSPIDTRLSQPVTASVSNLTASTQPKQTGVVASLAKSLF